jgi:2-amino-4-hydroxy-6-hydroxymethyldihydropteridine diphosphokinase
MAIRKLFIGIGSNLGDRLHYLTSAKSQIELKFNAVPMCSSIYESEPWGFKEQEPFLNQVISVETELNPLKIWDLLFDIEKSLGRLRVLKFGPRTIDLDIILLGTMYFKNNSLTIPHPQMQRRRFVLEPLAELDREIIHPLFSTSIKQLLIDCDDAGQITKYHHYEKQS